MLVKCELRLDLFMSEVKMDPEIDSGIATCGYAGTLLELELSSKTECRVKCLDIGGCPIAYIHTAQLPPLLGSPTSPVLNLGRLSLSHSL